MDQRTLPSPTRPCQWVAGPPLLPFPGASCCPRGVIVLFIPRQFATALRQSRGGRLWRCFGVCLPGNPHRTTRWQPREPRTSLNYGRSVCVRRRPGVQQQLGSDLSGGPQSDPGLMPKRRRDRRRFAWRWRSRWRKVLAIRSSSPSPPSTKIPGPATDPRVAKAATKGVSESDQGLMRRSETHWDAVISSFGRSSPARSLSMTPASRPPSDARSRR
jgi:hypothetical protein